jgi:hypothetical protein
LRFGKPHFRTFDELNIRQNTQFHPVLVTATYGW